MKVHGTLLKRRTPRRFFSVLQRLERVQLRPNEIKSEREIVRTRMRERQREREGE